jgi:hypothetical protein
MAVPLKGGSSRTLWHLGETVVGETLGNAAVGFGYDTRPSGQPSCSRRSRHREGGTDRFPCELQTNSKESSPLKRRERDRTFCDDRL